MIIYPERCINHDFFTKYLTIEAIPVKKKKIIESTLNLDLLFGLFFFFLSASNKKIEREKERESTVN